MIKIIDRIGGYTDKYLNRIFILKKMATSFEMTTFEPMKT
jgi:hypothetical protein